MGIEITGHGHPVAAVPHRRLLTREQLIGAGLLRPGRGDVLDVEPVTAPDGTPSTAELLAEARAER